RRDEAATTTTLQSGPSWTRDSVFPIPRGLDAKITCATYSTSPSPKIRWGDSQELALSVGDESVSLEHDSGETAENGNGLFFLGSSGHFLLIGSAAGFNLFLRGLLLVCLRGFIAHGV